MSIMWFILDEYNIFKWNVKYIFTKQICLQIYIRIRFD